MSYYQNTIYDEIKIGKPISELSQYREYMLECTLEGVLGLTAGIIVNQTIKNLIHAYPKVPMLTFFILQVVFSITLMFIFEYYSIAFATSWNVSRPGIIFVTLFFTVQRNYGIYFYKLFEYGDKMDTFTLIN